MPHAFDHNCWFNGDATLLALLISNTKGRGRRDQERNLSARAQGSTGVLHYFLRAAASDLELSSLVISIMQRCFLAFFLGALTVTGCVVATGTDTGGLLMLGFLIATAFYLFLAAVIGPRRLMRLLSLLSGEPNKTSNRHRTRNVVRRSQVEDDVISALVHQGTSSRTGSKVTAAAALQAPQEFEPLFRTAVGLLRFQHRS